MKDELFNNNFIVQGRTADPVKEQLSGPNGWLLFVACNAGIEFCSLVAEKYGQFLQNHQSTGTRIPFIGSKSNPITRIFSDTETCPRLDHHAAGSDAFVFQCAQENITGNTVNENIQQLLQVVRTLKAHRAKSITVVMPYLPYSRQDKPTFMKREAALAALLADQLKVAGADICMAYHPHTLSLYGFYEPEIRMVALSGLELFTEIFKDKRGSNSAVAVSTDSGGAKFIVHFAQALDISYAISNKFRTGQDQSTVLGIIGDLKNKTSAIIVDDETVTGASILNVVKSLYQDHGIKDISVAVSHLKLKPQYINGLVEAHELYGLREVHITDSIPQPKEILKIPFIKVHSVANIFAAVINRLHHNMSISEIFNTK